MFIGGLEDTPIAEPEVSDYPPKKIMKSSELNLRKDDFDNDDDPFRAKKLKKIGLDLESDTEDQAEVEKKPSKVNSIAKKTVKVII